MNRSYLKSKVVARKLKRDLIRAECLEKVRHADIEYEEYVEIELEKLKDQVRLLSKRVENCER